MEMAKEESPCGFYSSHSPHSPVPHCSRCCGSSGRRNKAVIAQPLSFTFLRQAPKLRSPYGVPYGTYPSLPSSPDRPFDPFSSGKQLRGECTRKVSEQEGSMIKRTTSTPLSGEHSPIRSTGDE